MISQKLQDAINGQITKEIWSANLYLSMAFYFDKEGWKKEVEMIKEHYKKFDRLPAELAEQLKALEARLEK